MNKPELTIIIPCYNCSQTLEQAFDSCFHQDLSIPFEIVMVDDCSTDSTRDVMTQLAKKKENVTLGFNKKNLGGGATRNEAVRLAKADVIFCLDSDDMLGNGTLEKMYKLIKEKSCDGVGIQTSIKFKGDDVNDVAFINEFGYVGEQIPLESLIEKDATKMCSLYSTFMFTRKAFDITGGYPIDHGFDTQSFAWRFLVHGLIAYTCPGATYLHRIQFTKSYYIREYESGKINHNWYKIFEEFLYIFDEKTQELILNFELNDPTKHILDLLKKRDTVFKKEVGNSLGDRYWLGTQAMTNADFVQAFDIFEQLVKNGLNTGYVHYYLKTCGEKIGKKSDILDEQKIQELFSYKKQGSQLNILVRIFRKIVRIIR